MQPYFRQTLSTDSGLWHASGPLPRRNTKIVTSKPVTEGYLLIKQYKEQCRYADIFFNDACDRCEGYVMTYS